VALEDFHCVVVGNEPAGLWLLSALDKSLREVGEVPRLAWVSLDTPLAQHAFPTSLSPFFGISPNAPWSCEIITPQETFSWSAKELKNRYGDFLPSVENSMESFLTPSAKDRMGIKDCIRRHPELVGLAQSLWTFLGRSTRLNVETLAHFSRFFVHLHWWTPEKDLPPSVQRIRLSPTDNLVEKISRKGAQAVAIDFLGLGAIEAQHWVFNLGVRAARVLSARSESFRSTLGTPAEMAKMRGLYPFTLRVETEAVPASAAPLNFLLDTCTIPDPATEVWPVTLGASADLRELTVWAESGAATSIEACLDGFQKAIRRLNHLFPFLALRTVQTPFSLGMDSCSSDAERKRVTELLLSTSHEIYPLTTSATQTRLHRVHSLSPQLGCHLPYPLGPLIKAKGLQREILRRKKKPAEPRVRRDSPELDHL
jgi:hypothetical protein